MKRLYMIAVSVALTAGVTAVARADTVAGSSGIPWPNADDSCFEFSWGQMTNNCSGLKTLVFSVEARRFNTWEAALARIKGNGTAATSCKGIVLDPFNGAYIMTSTVSETTTNLRSKWFSNIYIPDRANCQSAGGCDVYTIQFECQVPLNGAVQTIDWGQY